MWSAPTGLVAERPIHTGPVRQLPTGVGVTNVHRHLERLSEAGVLTPFPLHRRGAGLAGRRGARGARRVRGPAGRRTRS
ncbi:hypothetical protein GCM10009714_00500 [Microlunatus capsulatus]